jgi:hypothetical protein
MTPQFRTDEGGNMLGELCEHCGNQIIDEGLAEEVAGYFFCGQHCADEFVNEEA